MSKRFALALVVLLVVPMLLTACSSESQDTAEDYVKAVLHGETDKAVALACDSYQAKTEEYAAAYGTQDIHALDLKFDVGKGNNQEEIIVTGSYDVGRGDRAVEFELAQALRRIDDAAEGDEVVLREPADSRIVLWLQEQDGEWCVTDESYFGPMELDAEEQAEAVDEAEPNAEEDVSGDEDVSMESTEPATEATAEAE